MRTWATCKPQKNLARTHWSTTIPSRKMAVKSLFTRQSGQFYQAVTVKTHGNNLVVLAYVQLMPFYRLSTRDVTHVRKCTRPSPALPYCKRQEAGGGGLGTRLHLWYVNYVLHLVGSIFQQECFSNRAKVKKHSVHLSELSQIKKIHVHLY